MNELNPLKVTLNEDNRSKGKESKYKSNYTDVALKNPNCPSGEVGEADVCEVND